MPKALDLTGKRFGHLTAMFKSGSGGPGVIWHCVCDCGNEIDVPAYRLTTGDRTSCGCAWHESKAMDLTGMRFGNLLVVKRSGTANGHATWLCKCDCGNEAIVVSDRLRNGHTKSCGCNSSRNHIGEIGRKNRTTHGMSNERLHRVWKQMIQRCENPKTKGYKNYGGRGICVCDQWRKSYRSFYDWAMANGYDPDAQRGECTIDRIDNDGNYEPSNCRWVDMKVQRANQRQLSVA